MSSKVETSVRPSVIKTKTNINQNTIMETILAFSLGMVTVISIMVAVVVVKLYKNSDRMSLSIQDYNLRLNEQDTQIGLLSGELHRRIDEEVRELQRQLDSRLDKLEDRLTSKTVLKG